MNVIKSFILLLLFFILYTKFIRTIAYKISQTLGLEAFINSIFNQITSRK